MRAFLIDPVPRTVEQLDFQGDYEEIQRALGYDDARPLFTVIEVQNGDTLFVDDEGLLKPGLSAFHWRGYHAPLAGKGLLLGTDREGSSTDARATLEEVREHVVWTDLVTTGDFDDSGGTVELPNGTVAIMGPQPIWGVR